MHSSSYSMLQATILALCLGLVMSAALPSDYFINAPMDKKSTSNLREFMTALNGASRLRYGKRSLNADYESNDLAPIYPMRMMFEKRMSPNLFPGLVDSLNTAERLRFGK